MTTIEEFFKKYERPQSIIDEIKQQMIDFLFDFHDEKGLKKQFDRAKFEKVFLDKNISKGKIDTAILELEESSTLRFDNRDNTISMLESYYRQMVRDVEKTPQDAREIITLKEYQATTQSINEISEQVLKNTNDYEIRNIAENLKASNKLIEEKKGKVTQAFITYIKKSLEALYQLIRGIEAFEKVANLILKIIELLIKAASA